MKSLNPLPLLLWTLQIFWLAVGLFCLPASAAQAQPELYVKTYGNPAKPALLYIHGGPRGNSTLFEGTTAEALADRGFYVIVYDRRGEGRSADSAASFTFDEAFTDLNALFSRLKLNKVNLLGHSFGGIVATLYSEKHPKKIRRLFLIGALVNQQQSYDHILQTATVSGREQANPTIVQQVQAIQALDGNSAQYRGLTYQLAAELGYFRMPNPTAEYRQLTAQYQNSAAGQNNIRNDQAPVKFYQNEERVNIDTTSALKRIKASGIGLYALYGKQDGIFSEAQLSQLRQLTGPAKFAFIDNCSHYPFVDQQQAFLDQIEHWMGDSVGK
jgi:proline iminopeptidase